MRRFWIFAIALSVTASACSASNDAAPPKGSTPEKSGAATTTLPLPAGDDLHVVSQNILHGIGCPDGHEDCQGDDRVALFLELLEGHGCPELVGIQEMSQRIYDRFTASLPEICNGDYVAYVAKPVSVDYQMILSTLPPVGEPKLLTMTGTVRSAYGMRVRSAVGEVAFVVTHTDGGDGTGNGGSKCERGRCVPPCKDDMPVSLCEIMVSRLLAEELGAGALAIVVGDFNVVPFGMGYNEFADNGWIDTFINAGGLECDPEHIESCTSGRRDTVPDDILDPADNQFMRIDYIWVLPGENCEASYDTLDDGDGDGLGTNLFPTEPALDGPGGIAWVSDHTGTSLDLSCTSTD